MDNLAKLRILIVEDEALIAEEIRDRLQTMNATIVGVVDTADEAVRIADAERPDIVLMDIRLKGDRDGIQAASEIYDRLNIPAIFLTAYSDRATLDRVVKVGQFGYLTKPFREKDLATTISLAYHRHQVETGLRESQLSLYEIFSKAVDGLMAVDGDACIRYMNESAERLIGTTGEDGLGKAVDRILNLRDEDTGERMTGVFRDVLDGSSPPVRDRVCLVRRSDSSETPIELSVMPVLDGDSIVGAAVSLRSLIERRRAEAVKERSERALREQRLLLGTLIDGLPEMFFAVDDKLRVVVVNHALLETFGLERADVIGTPLAEIFADGGLADVDSQAAMSIRTGNRVTYQQRAWVDADGDLRWFSFSYMPMPPGSDIALACTAIEISERRQIEDELLEAANRERRRLGRDLHDTLGQELASLALMIRSLETKIAKVVPNLLPDTAQVKECLAHALDSMRATARGLTPTDLRSGGLYVALRKLAAQCGKTRRVSCEFVGNVDEIPPLAGAVADHIYRFAQEAVSNSMRHADAATITITLAVRGTNLALSVEDDGKGMDISRVAEQAGLGMRIMEYRAHKVGGTVEFERPASGTRVVLEIPLSLLTAINSESDRIEGSNRTSPIESPP